MRIRLSVKLKRVLAMSMAVLIGLTVFSSCGQSAPSGETVPDDFSPRGYDPKSSAGEDSDSYWQGLLAQLSLEEKIGQLFIIRPDQLDLSFEPSSQHSHYSHARTLSASMQETLKKYPAGGFIIFDKNIESTTQLLAFTDQMRRLSRVVPFVSVDEEGGSVTRLAHAPSKGFRLKQYKSMASIGASKDVSKAFEVGNTIGTYLKEYGFNLDFAPVADVNTNPKNIVIGDRAFGSDPQLVADMVCAYVDGLHQGGVLSCTKHFPGHGDTSADTHSGAVVVNKTWDELKTTELVPFIASAEKTDVIMIAHINLPGATSDGLPASLSKELLTGKLRGELGYEGLITTDSLAMGAIQNHYGSGEAAVLALEAGVDILLMPLDYVGAFEGVLEALRSGRISQQRLDESVLRILKAKGAVSEDKIIR